MKNFALLAAGIAFVSGTHAYADRKWNEANDPKNFESNYIYNFNRLPLDGNLDAGTKGWSDSYWPATRGYIADRWQVPGSAFNFKEYTAPPAYRLSSMTESQLNLLSPAEKFDIIRGKFDYPILTELKKANPGPKDWWRGLCGGWTAASLAIDEPAPIVYQTRTGLKVPMGSGDIKGLLAYYYANLDRGEAAYVGKSCRGYKKLFFGLDSSCSDMNAAAFHVVMTNELGLRKHGFAMDRDPGAETWNQPVVAFTSKVLNIKNHGLSKKKSDGAVKEVTMSATVTYVNELYDTKEEMLENDKHVAPNYERLGKGNQHYGTLTYEYVLELDAYDNIIGGDWTGGDDHPDMLWRQKVKIENMASDTASQKDDWSILADILKQS
ncbi:MAG: hypothetical protein H7333_02185, partial [Bdellovibrionales bacterium]|nr:hypothetical protein [Oligoflexia bacterium]